VKDFSSIIIVITLVMGFFFVVKTIEKHSVHPVYGNYKKVDSELKKCEPWKACK